MPDESTDFPPGTAHRQCRAVDVLDPLIDRVDRVEETLAGIRTELEADHG